MPEAISYKKFLEIIKKDKLSETYVFFGDNKSLIKKSIDSLKERLLKSSIDMNFNTFDGEKDNIETVLDTTKTYPMFSDKRIVVLDSVDKLNKNSIDKLQGYINNPSANTVLILIFKEKKQINLKILGGITLINFELTRKDLVELLMEDSRERGFGIRPNTINFIIDLVGTNLETLINEINKIANLAGNNNDIKEEDIIRVVNQSINDDTFTFNSNFLNKNPKQLFNTLVNLERTNTDTTALLSSLSWRLRQLWKFKELQSKKENDLKISKELKTSKAALYYFKKEAAKISIAEIRNILKQIYLLDRKGKTNELSKKYSLTKCSLDKH